MLDRTKALLALCALAALGGFACHSLEATAQIKARGGDPKAIGTNDIHYAVVRDYVCTGELAQAEIYVLGRGGSHETFEELRTSAQEEIIKGQAKNDPLYDGCCARGSCRKALEASPSPLTGGLIIGGTSNSPVVIASPHP